MAQLPKSLPLLCAIGKRLPVVPVRREVLLVTPARARLASWQSNAPRPTDRSEGDVPLMSSTKQSFRQTVTCERRAM